MTRFEFNEVLKVMGINQIKEEKDLGFTKEPVYTWNNLDIYYDNMLYARVLGEYPQEVLDIINSKNQNDSSEDIYNIYESSKEKHKTRTKEGLILLLTEYNNYYNHQNTDFNDLVIQANKKELQVFNPSISNYIWMIDNHHYTDTIQKDNSDAIWTELREAINEFDKAVNPFLDYSASFKDMHDYINNIRLEICNYGTFEFQNENGCGHIDIHSLTSNVGTRYDRNPDGFSYILRSYPDNYSFIDFLSHYYFMNNELIEYEVQSARIYPYHPRYRKTLLLNITERKIINKHREVIVENNKDLEEQLIKIIALIKEKTEYAKTITDDMINKEKKIVKKRKI